MMKNILLIGDSDNIRSILSKILLSNKATCVHNSTLFQAIKTLYGNRIDTLVISSKEVKSQKYDFLSYLTTQFSSLRIFITQDNGVANFISIPDSIELISPENTDLVQL